MSDLIVYCYLCPLKLACPVRINEEKKPASTCPLYMLLIESRKNILNG